MRLLRWINAGLDGVAKSLASGPPLRTFLGICAIAVVLHVLIHALGH